MEILYQVGDSVVITDQFVRGVVGTESYGDTVIQELQKLVGTRAVIKEILRSGYSIELSGRDGLFPVYPDEIKLEKATEGG